MADVIKNSNEPAADGEQQYSDLVRVRREKLKELVSKGKDPFEEVKFERKYERI